MELCKICGEKKATANHIKTHGFTYDDYLKEFDPDKYYERAMVDRINDLYVTNRYKFAIMNKHGQYTTVQDRQVGKGEKKALPLNDSDIKRHLQQKHTLAVLPLRDKTKFITFDIDRQDLNILEDIHNALTRFVSPSSLLITSSGNKGYHIDLFLEELILNSHAEQFYKLILSETGYREHEVEGYGFGNKPVKIPFGVHFKTGKYCYPTNQYGNDNSQNGLGYDQLLRINKEPLQKIYDAIEMNPIPKYLTDSESIEADEMLTNYQSTFTHTIDKKEANAQRLLQEGFKEPGKRNESTVIIATYLKHKGFDENESIEKIIKWNHTKNQGLYKDEKEMVSNTRSVVKTVFKKNYRVSETVKNPSLSGPELKEILTVKKAHLRLLYFILFMHSKAYSDHTGAFYMTYEQMGQAGANGKDRRALKKYIEELQSLGKLEIVRSNYRVEGQKKHEPNFYRLPANSYPLEIVNVNSFKTCERAGKDCFSCSCVCLLSESELKESFDRRKVPTMKKEAKNCKK
ncbi:TOTE conflict system archaeo-eukaryotic primase domain-containing protein [Priestia aryabhattai]|uniref:TOTE conflict system archaeo-eukaryotic primase domain-containing protein n=1 Tax=Priestia aryabhattai TaxID=412384 RepID=UPI002E217A73|nr:hypothetical protein [Priestia aryabhattai]